MHKRNAEAFTLFIEFLIFIQENLLLGVILFYEFYKHKESCNHHHKQERKHFHHPHPFVLSFVVNLYHL